MSESFEEAAGADHVVIDGGDRSCGELLLVLHREMRHLVPGTVVELVAHDPVAPIDLPVWCHLTGHHYLGPRLDAVDTYQISVSAQARQVRADRPWHLLPAEGHAQGTTDPEHHTHREIQESA